MSEETQTAKPAFEPVRHLEGARWCRVEIFGHRRHDGRVTEVDRFGAKFCRVEVFCRDGHLVAAPEYGGAALFGVTDLPGREATARRLTGIAECRHSSHDEEKARAVLPPWDDNEESDDSGEDCDDGSE